MKAEYAIGVVGVVFILLLFAQGIPSIYYAAIIFFSFASIKFFTRIAKPSPISKREFLKLDAKFSKKVLGVDALSILLVLGGSAVLYFFFSLLKTQAYAETTSNRLFVSNPQGMLFIAAFLFCLSIVGWIIHWAVKRVWGNEYWKYYFHRSEVGFDTEKVYRVISIIALLLAAPFLFFGFLDFSSINENGLQVNDWTKIEPVQYRWEEIVSITSFQKENKKSFYVITFSNATKWNLSNENWNVDKREVMAFISEKSGIEITNE